MRPTLAAAALRANLSQYLITTFGLTEESVREGLRGFLAHPEQGLFRGPYLRIRTPFRAAPEGWRDDLEWAPAGFTPYLHQAKAFARLSTVRSPAAPTLITTGTGSGKTESFLYPILDHCRRARAQGRRGVKAVLLYPMNALATDQTLRIDSLLGDAELQRVTAGLYIGDVPATTYAQVMTKRSEMRRTPPDVLVTNYKMLDLLLQREDDLPLWEHADLAFVVLDEFHTYDGAQGTDVAMLLRRLGAALGCATPERPLGAVCPVATSATLGSGGGSDAIRKVAGQVFGVPFDEASLIGEDRYDADEFVITVDFDLPLPTPEELAAPADDDPDLTATLARLVLGSDDLDPARLGARLRRHPLTKAVLAALGPQPRTFGEVIDVLPRKNATGWGSAMRTRPEITAKALTRFVGLLALARNPEAPDRPLLNIETHLWVRAVSRLLRGVDHEATFGWDGEPPRDPDPSAPALDLVVADRGQTRLPAIYCRHCGRSGWMAYSPERDPHDLRIDPEEIYRAGVGRDKRRLRAFVAATADELREIPGRLLVLEHGRHVRPFDAGRDIPARPGEVAVLADLRVEAAQRDRCPACDTDHGIRYVGAGLATLAAVAITQLFTGGELAAGERKTLLFNDSVQDAAHRAGFVANRSHTFSLRTLLAEQLTGGPVGLDELIAKVVAAAADPKVLSTVVPPDLHDQPGVDALLAGEDPGSRTTWTLIGERLAFAAVMEVGLRARQGRTLEQTRAAAIDVALDDPVTAAAICRDVLVTGPAQLMTLPDDARLLAYLRGLLERMRHRGAISHQWLGPYLRRGGRRWQVWRGRPTGLPAFPHGVSAPAFLLATAKAGSEFDAPAVRGSWYQDWTTRCLGLPGPDAAGYLARLLPALAAAEVIASVPTDDGNTVYGLTPGHLRVTRLDDDQVGAAGIGCDTCHWEQTEHPDRIGDWVGQPCRQYRCTGRLRPTVDPTAADDYYRRLYLERPVFRVVTAEHTGMLTRAQRETVEAAFRDGRRYTAPNVLSCTPTLEMGIDIGELSAVVLASLPAGPAQYVQRSGRAGRRSGSAFVLTLVGRSDRDRYYLTEPRDLIAGDIVPPGCFLSAVEILRRQYVALLVDRAARGALPGVLPLPHKAHHLFGPSGWLGGLATAAARDGSVLAETFLGLFGDDVTPSAAARLRAFAHGGLTDRVATAEQAWLARQADLRDRLDEIKAAMGRLVPSDPDHARELRMLRSEAYAVRRRLNEVGAAPAHATLVELGLLPNYALLDARTELEATLTWEDRDPDGDRRFHTELREYARPARQALTEIAPGNSYYVRGYRHEISALDIGRPDRPAYEQWRLCPGCGFVRIYLAREDTSRCPRCHGEAIADHGQLFDVLRPTRVRSRDRRDDAHIRDDDDDRDSRFYATVTAVDVDPEDVTFSWRHRSQTFGVDHTRQARIRTLNLGAQRFDRPPVHLAGEEVRINPFHTCLTCGGTTVDGVAVVSQQLAAQSSGATVPAGGEHHLPWCVHRRSPATAAHVELLLAHELHTEALRILVPAVTALVEERQASFAAALRLGIAREYGGDPAHLRVTTAVLPDRPSGAQRHFTVVYDIQPQGTGYLDRLADPEEFRRVLERARHAVETCACVTEGRSACHRCLLRYARNQEFALMSRATVLDVLAPLLDDWQVDRGARTDEISLIDQVESELELRFLTRLHAWADDPSTPVRIEKGNDRDGARIRELWFTAPGGRITHWRMRVQNTIRGTRPDLQFTRLDDASADVCVYLDGFKYHASARWNRLADDAAKRSTLRGHGYNVLALTWEDIEGWGTAGASPPYGGLAQQAARALYRKVLPDRDPVELDATTWANPVELLLAFLAEPDADLWRRRTEATLAGVLKLDSDKTVAGSGGIGERVLAAARDEPLPPSVSGGITLVRARDDAGCPIVLLVDARGPHPVWSALTVIDDRPAAVADDAGHRTRWAAWLRWANIVPFLDTGGGDGVQLARSAVDAFDPEQLAVSEGTGLALARRDAPLDEETASWLGRTEPPPPAAPVEVDGDEKWSTALRLFDREESALEMLLHELVRHGVPGPEVGYELGPDLWPAEIAWPDRRIAIVLADAPEAQDRDRAYDAAGWRVRTARQWNAAELAEEVLR